LLAPAHLLGFGVYQTLDAVLLFACLWYCAGIWSWAFAAAGLLVILVPGLPLELGTVFGYAAGWAMPVLYVGSYLAIWVGAIRLSGWADRLPRLRRDRVPLAGPALT
jgi:hypothetical protein